MGSIGRGSGGIMVPFSVGPFRGHNWMVREQESATRDMVRVQQKEGVLGLGRDVPALDDGKFQVLICHDQPWAQVTSKGEGFSSAAHLEDLRQNLGRSCPKLYFQLFLGT